VPEGLSPSEVGKEIAEHHKKAAEKAEEEDANGSAAEPKGHDRLIVIVEAILLAVVAVLAAWSGFAAAKWSTHSSLELAKALAARTEANRADFEGFALRNFDSSTFDAWFSAYVAGNKRAERMAELRFRPNFLVAFNAWMKTHPSTNPRAPKGPTYMPEYIQPELVQANALNARADAYYTAGEQAGTNADNYVRTTVYLATVLFLVGISGHFRVRAARIGLIGVGGVILVFSCVLLIMAPKPPV
jgi:hypothetical protein